MSQGDLNIWFAWCKKTGVASLDVKAWEFDAFVKYLLDERGNKPQSVHLIYDAVLEKFMHKA